MLNRFGVFVLLLGLVVIGASCERIAEIELEIPEIGETKEGGSVGYILRSSDPGYVEGEVHGIIVSPEVEVFESQWGCFGTAVTGTSTGVGTGKTNTELVIAFHDNLPDYYNNPTQCSELNDGTVAAKLADLFNVNGYDDWYMPSREEMRILYENREAIGGFVEEEYWSSCESNATNACVFSFVTGAAMSAPKHQRKKVRLIRYF
ncbi:MAG: DUF1566 domain-containing protein [Lunatimonas sp.]|uniref:Lcl domain-containing protein n=1 Tax=Lunatimonas sp. TaxID=2060141 RepID=UPI00263AB5B4|nr:DUF1566 domain-containing protein [Lunatimonas sp.]MCC5938209.1 DUF1566 domain-containing protein [Lunatimonas sp.]